MWFPLVFSNKALLNKYLYFFTKTPGFLNETHNNYTPWLYRRLTDVSNAGYSFINDPWWCMPYEALECFTVSLMSAAAVSYAADLATPSTLATLQGMYGGLHYGVGEYTLARDICKGYIYVQRATEEAFALHFVRVV